MQRVRRWAIVLITSAALPTSRSAAQRPAGADTLSPSAVAESLKVLVALRTQLDVRRNQGNAALWYHRGLLSWALYLRDRAQSGVPGLDWTLLGREADTSLRLASRLAPKNVRYQLTKGQYFANSGWVVVTLQSLHVFDVALERARASRDPQLIAEAAIEKGMVHWKRYGGLGFDRAPPSAVASDVDDTIQRRRDMAMRDFIAADPRNAGAMNSLLDGRDFYGRIIARDHGDFSGEADYRKAEEFFREAYAAKPTYLRAFMQLAMVLDARQRWTELTALARERIAQDPHHAWAWMTLGFALHRTGNSLGALAAFDSGLANMGANERAGIDDIARVIAPSEVPMVRAWTATELRTYEDWYWVWSAPMWSVEETHPRAEFLARVTQAELRWTTDGFAKRGADTDRGQVLVRYGPADGGHGAHGTEVWWYDHAGLAFYFRGDPGFGIANFTDETATRSVIESMPASWDNLLRVRVDSLPVRVARFRAPPASRARSPDSLDLVFSYLAPVDAIRESAELDTPVRVNFWLLGDAVHEAQHDTTDLRMPGVVTFSRRVPPGSYRYRFEATNDAATVGARAAAGVKALTDTADEFSTSGFGISDLLIATRAAPRGTPKRWTDFDISAAPGEFAPGSDLALVWESYDLGARDGTADYSVTLTLQRKWTGPPDRARIFTALSALFQKGPAGDRMTFHYDRRVPAAVTIPDYVTLTLGNVAAVDYDVTVEIADHVSGRTTARSAKIRVR